LKVENEKLNPQFPILNSPFSILFVFSMQPVAAAATTKFLELQASRRVLFIFCRHVIPLFALGTLQNYVISRHKSLARRSRIAAAAAFCQQDNN
jgi:hypothetical protein